MNQVLAGEFFDKPLIVLSAIFGKLEILSSRPKAEFGLSLPSDADRSMTKGVKVENLMTTNKKITNVFEAILEYGHDEDFVPSETEDFVATDAPAGSDEKIEILRRRVEMGLPLWHELDREDYSGLTGAVRPRE